jgi:hypothetical protein
MLIPVTTHESELVNFSKLHINIERYLVPPLILRSLLKVDRDSSVGIPTRYGLDSPGIESLWGRGFPHKPRPDMESIQPPTQWVPDLSRR